MSLRSPIPALLLAHVLVAVPLIADSPDPCAPRVMGAMLSETIVNIGFARTALSALDGKEHPTLRALLEAHLLFSAHHARWLTEKDVSLQSPSISVPNLLAAVDRAVAFVSEHNLAARQDEHPAVGVPSALGDDLLAIQKWLKAQNPQTQ